MHTAYNSSLISKWAGGIGIPMHKIRCRGTYIAGTQGRSSGIVQQLKIFNEVACCWDQGGKRRGALAIYLEPWHGDIMNFLKLKLPNGAETERARDLFYAMWIPDLFVARANENGPWSLFTGKEAERLSLVYDGMNDRPAFTELYCRYEREGRAVKTLQAREILEAIFMSQRESGNPYICFKDHANRKSNHKNMGTIQSSNLCAEIYEWARPDSYACCTLASVNLPKHLVLSPDGAWQFAFEQLSATVRQIVRNLNRVVDINSYPVEECARNNMAMRPIAIGVQGLANIFCKMRIPFLSDEAARIDLQIAECMYYSALSESVELAREFGPYNHFEGSPASKGILQFDMWADDLKTRGVNLEMTGSIFSGHYDWDSLKTDIIRHGLRNSLVLAYMPTVSTSQILGNNESFEPFASNVYTKDTLAGKFTITNVDMIKHLGELGLWSIAMRDDIAGHGGSIRHRTDVPLEVRRIYETVWELSQREIMRRAALRGAFIDQGQSLNLYTQDNSNTALSRIFMYGWYAGLKTGSYYIHTRPAGTAVHPATAKASLYEGAACKRDNPNCESCSG